MSMLLVVLSLMSIIRGRIHCQLNIMVPAYFYPYNETNLGYWQTLNTQAARIPQRLVAITNPDSGPGNTNQSSDFKPVISRLQAASGLSIGYVKTNYTRRPFVDVTADVDTYYSFFPTMNGIFFDEVSYDPGNESYYQSLYNYVKSKDSTAMVVNNPGASTKESYLMYKGSRVTDVVCVFENSPDDTNSTQRALDWRSEDWAKNNLTYPRNNFCAIFYNISNSAYKSVIEHAYEQNLNVGWVYVTNDIANGKYPDDNPYDTLPPYFVDEVTAAASFH